MCFSKSYCFYFSNKMGCSNSSSPAGKPRNGKESENQKANGESPENNPKSLYDKLIIQGRPDQEYEIETMLEHTEYGDVNLAVHKEKQYKRCIKMYRKTDEMSQMRENVKFAKQIEKFKNFVHPNILRLHDLYEDENNYYTCV